MMMHQRLTLLLACMAAILFSGCEEEKISYGAPVVNPPNIVWIVAEDLSPIIPPFGDSTIQTPNLSRLAAEGIRYPNTFSVSGVCAPSRAAIATGMYSISIGAHHMRTRLMKPQAEAFGMKFYEAVPPPEVKMMSEILRKNGYYCTNNDKRDYQFKPSLMAWDESSGKAHWKSRSPDQPFFAIYNLNVTHESQVFGPTAKRNLRFRPGFPDDSVVKVGGLLDSSEWVLHVPKDLDVPVPPYLPRTPPVIADVRRVYSNIAVMDQQVGFLLDQLEADGLMDNTIIVWYTDHGGPLPRQKRLLYDSGLRVPMIIRFPDQRDAGTVDSQLVSFVDLAPTMFSLAGIQPPDYLQGQAFLGTYRETPRQYIYAAADRLDTEYDRIRVVRDQRYKYFRNYNPEKRYYLEVEYRERMNTMQELLKMNEKGLLNPLQAQWFRDHKPVEELFDTWNDPYELNNLADNPNFQQKLTEMRDANESFLKAVGDLGHLPEIKLIERMWGGLEQPQSENPSIRALENGLIEITANTKGASIGYQIVTDPDTEINNWPIYTEPFECPRNTMVKYVAHRLGYAPSEVLVWKRY